MILVGMIALAVGETGEFIPPAWLGMLGLVPVTLGVVALWKLFRKPVSRRVEPVVTGADRLAMLLALVGTQLSNGADTIITFTVLLADAADAADYLVAPTFLAMIGVFSALAYYSLKHRKLSQLLGRYGRYVIPPILILVGCYILSNTATDLVPG